jgi:hypothetical protein
MAWPQPEETKLTLELNSCLLEIPILNTSKKYRTEELFSKPEEAEPLPHKVIKEGAGRREITRNHKTGEVVYDVTYDGGELQFTDINLIYGSKNSQHYIIKDNDPLTAKMIYKADFKFHRENWHVETKSTLTVTCDGDSFFLKANISGLENSDVVFSRDWDVKVPRLVY